MNLKSLKKITAILMVLILMLSLAACGKKENDGNSGLSNKPEESNEAQKEFNELMQDIFIYDVTKDIYTLATSIKDVNNFGIEVPEDISYDSFKIEYTSEELNEQKAEVTGFLSRLIKIDYDSLSDYQKFVYDKMEAEFALALESFDLNDLYSPLAINNGWISAVEINMYEYIFDDEQDIADYQKLLETLPGIMQTIPDYIQMQIDEYGYAPSDYMIEENVNILTDLQDKEDNPFIDGYNSKIDNMGLDESKAKEYKEANEEYVTEVLFPAFAELENEIEKFIGSCDEVSGLYYAEGGEEYYNYLIKSNGFDLDAQGMFDYLYDKFYDTYNAQMKIAEEDYGALMEYYNDEYELDVPEEPEDIMEQLISEFSGEFPSIKNEGYELSYLPKSLEIEGMLAYCVLNRLDDANGITCMRVNGDQVGGDMETLYITLAHEGYPGHMLHSNYYYNSMQYPEEGMLHYLGYIEGWARYAEDKACYKMGVGSSIAKLCQSDGDMNYTLMGLLDVAVNGLGYDAVDINNMMSDFFGSYDIEQSKTLVESFSADPGLYIPYSAGYWYTYDLIKDYKEVYGDTLSRSEIYEKYMSLGPAPFSVLRKYLLGE